MPHVRGANHWVFRRADACPLKTGAGDLGLGLRIPILKGHRDGVDKNQVRLGEFVDAGDWERRDWHGGFIVEGFREQVEL